MRELKFRAWGLHHYQTQTVRDYYVYFKLGDLDEYYVIPDGSYLDEMCKGLPKPVIEQYTGLHDKNGKEIYEGDILSDVYYHIPLPVQFVDGGFWCVDEKSGGFTHHIPHKEYREVIGNIHENPELLEAQP